MIKAAPLVVAVLLTFGCGSSGGGAASGLRGTVTRGPLQPVCRLNVPCTGPARSTHLLFIHDGDVAGTATTNRRGQYRVTLPPGRYTVRTTIDGPESNPRPDTATVTSGAIKRLNLYLDTGIR